MTIEPRQPEALSRLATLDDPLRRRLYDYVAAHDDPVSRDQAAKAVGIGRTLAAYHLDKLADAGLLTVLYRRPPGRGGPGAGRPAKLYERADREFSLSVPPRDYELLARLLAEAICDGATVALHTALDRAAGDAGRAAGQPAGDVFTALSRRGYQPRRTADGDIELRNCPFHRLAQEHRDLVCGLNLRLVDGVIDGSAATAMHTQLDPSPGRCCVVIHGSPSADSARRRRARTSGGGGT